MKTKKLIRYRVAVSVKFPATHPRKGEDTYFAQKIMRNIDCKKCPHELCDNCGLGDVWNKLHTIRGNYELWQKRFKRINEGKAVIELYKWSGKPYNSKCVTICQLGKEHGVGVQKLEDPSNFIFAAVDGKTINWDEIAKNDGLSFNDFCEWFKIRGNNTMAIIHFTHFRY